MNEKAEGILLAGLADDTRPVWEELSQDMVEMIYVECPSCGYHMGVDYTFMEQAHEGALDIECPACTQRGQVEAVE